MRIRTLSPLLIALTSAPALAAAPASAKVGQPAPAFTLKDESGQTQSLSKYAGKVVVLEWTNPECPFVARHYEAKTMQKTLAGFDSSKVVWLAVNSGSNNTPAKSSSWKKQEEISYPILQDPDGAVGKQYGAKTTPHMYVIDSKGVLRYAGAIDDDPRGKSDAPVNHVRAAVNAVLEGKPVPASTTEPYGCSVKYKSS